ncbi:CHAD domain-containing protein [Carboxylicivirga taeanensis]|uniref:CHAD domain-containing protein n=1 Tax=Carboxylicivirga taeanensis TaxID=1416875 RepID=UPI003F6DD95A
MYLFAIDNQEELQEGVTRVLGEQFNYIEYQTSIPKDIDTTVHEVRKALKRIRALLRLIRWDIGEELFLRENRKFRELGRQLSALRDYHVIITHLASHFEAQELQIPEANYIRLVEHVNQLKETELKQLVDQKTLVAIKNEMSFAREELANYPLESLGPHTIKHGVSHIYNQCLDKITESQLKLDDHPLHELRKKVKYLLNQMTLIQEVWPDFFKHYSLSLKRASDLLGDDHNIAETIILINKLPDGTVSVDDKAKLTQSFQSEREQIHRELWPLLGKLFTEGASAFVKRITSYWLISRE